MTDQVSNNAKCRWDQLDGAVSFRELLGQTKVMQIRQRETNHETCCLAAEYQYEKEKTKLKRQAISCMLITPVGCDMFGEAM